jgi:hypothetical protein
MSRLYAVPDDYKMEANTTDKERAASGTRIYVFTYSWFI